MDATLHRYAPESLVGDYLRSVAGMAICFSPLFFMQAGTVMVYVLGGLGTLFTVFGVRTAVRHATTIELSAEGVRTSGVLRRVLPWRDLSTMKLAYFSTRRDKKKGWMELKLKGAGTTVVLESNIEGFDEVVEAALNAARERDLRLSDVTRANLDAMGFAVLPQQSPDDHP